MKRNTEIRSGSEYTGHEHERWWLVEEALDNLTKSLRTLRYAGEGHLLLGKKAKEQGREVSLWELACEEIEELGKAQGGLESSDIESLRCQLEELRGTQHLIGEIAGWKEEVGTPHHVRLLARLRKITANVARPYPPEGLNSDSGHDRVSALLEVLLKTQRDVTEIIAKQGAEEEIFAYLSEPITDLNLDLKDRELGLRHPRQIYNIRPAFLAIIMALFVVATPATTETRNSGDRDRDRVARFHPRRQGHCIK